MPGEKRWVVTFSPDGPREAVRSRLEAAGFTVEQDLGEIGVVVGRADDRVAAALRAMDGVADVSPEGAIDIGPPNSPGTW